MPKVFTKDTVVNEVLTEDPRYEILEDDGTPFKADMRINLSTLVATPGTNVDADLLNNLGNGLDAIDTKLADTVDLLTTGGTSTAYTLTTIGVADLETGQRFRVKFNATAGTIPTLNRDAKGAKFLKYYNSAGGKSPCGSSNIIANMISDVIYDGIDYIVLDPVGAYPTYNLASGINGAIAKTTPASSDEFPLADSEASYVLKKMTFANLKLEVMKALYPIGTVVTLGVSTNPATLFGFGTWTAIAGRVVVGIDAGQTEFDTLNETGGAKTHTLTESEMPSHTHVQNSHTHAINSKDTATAFGTLTRLGQVSNTGTNATVTSAAETATNQNTGGGSSHNNLQPYIVKNVWERTA